MNTIILKFGLISAGILILLALSQLSISTPGYASIKVTLMALIFVGIGVGVSRMMKRKRESDGIDEAMIRKLGLSKRECEVLNHLASGKSNSEIGETLFISENTVKTHVSNILVKLDAKRRTDAVKIALEKNIVQLSVYSRQ